jgi:hypothetical protein
MHKNCQMRRGGLWVRSYRTRKRHDPRDKTRDFKCSRLEMFQGHVSGFHLMFTVLIPGDEWVSNRLFIVIPFDGHLSGPTRDDHDLVSHSYADAQCKKADRNGDDIQSMTYRSENQFDNK